MTLCEGGGRTIGKLPQGSRCLPRELLKFRLTAECWGHLQALLRGLPSASHPTPPQMKPSGNLESPHFQPFHQIYVFTSAEFATYQNYVRSLRFEEKPDYAYLRQLIRNLFHRQVTTILIFLKSKGLLPNGLAYFWKKAHQIEYSAHMIKLTWLAKGGRSIITLCLHISPISFSGILLRLCLRLEHKEKCECCQIFKTKLFSTTLTASFFSELSVHCCFFRGWTPDAPTGQGALAAGLVDPLTQCPAQRTRTSKALTATTTC